jgi:N-acetylglucosamine-6-phosphate deacetylase
MSGYVDLQVNGYAGVDFNALDLTLEDFHYAIKRICEDGTSQFLPTLITAPWEEMLVKIERIAGWIENGEVPSDIVPGLHIEGPFLSPLDGFIGAHPKEAALHATESRASELLDCGRDSVRLVTLAPEVDDRSAVTRLLSDRGVVVAAGHSDASLDELKRAIDQGLSLYTHLGNGCPSLLSRHDNIVQRILSLREHLSVSFIADGHHVPSFALRNYLNVLNDDRVVIVTDAISAAGLGPGRYELAGQTVEVDEDGAAWAACRTHYAGCATSFPKMIDFLRRDLSVTDQQINAWFIENPRRLLGL